MGNKNSSPAKRPESGDTQTEGGPFKDGNAGGSAGGPQGLSPELLASLQSLGENGDYTLLPHSLHQIAVAYSHKQDYQWAIQFLQLEKLYHERLLTNLATLQEDWESQWNETRDAETSPPPAPPPPAEAETISQNHMETLSQICRTHLRPSVSEEEIELIAMLQGLQTKNETRQPRRDKARKPATVCWDVATERSKTPTQTGCKEEEEEEGGGEQEVYEEGQEVEEEEEEDQEHCEETPEEEEVKVEWPTGVPQASDKDLAKLSNKGENSSPDGLVSILKRRRASLDGLPPPSTIAVKPNSKRKVRFSEPEDGIEQDEVGGDSCLILLLLCLVTVVISIGGTALYCTLVDTYSNICTDFTHNVDAYVTYVRRVFEGLGRWLPLRT
ncbi:unnamed protein product [Ophioblennius macclurei]